SRAFLASGQNPSFEGWLGEANCARFFLSEGGEDAGNSCRRTDGCGARAVPSGEGLRGLPDRQSHPGSEPTRLGERDAGTVAAGGAPEGVARAAPPHARTAPSALTRRQPGVKGGREGVGPSPPPSPPTPL